MHKHGIYFPINITWDIWHDKSNMRHTMCVCSSFAGLKTASTHQSPIRCLCVSVPAVQYTVPHKNIKNIHKHILCFEFIFIIHVYPIVIAIMHNIKFTRKLPNWMRIRSHTLCSSLFGLSFSLSECVRVRVRVSLTHGSFRLLITYSFSPSSH